MRARLLLIPLCLGLPLACQSRQASQPPSPSPSGQPGAHASVAPIAPRSTGSSPWAPPSPGVDDADAVARYVEFIARLDAQRRVRAEQWGAALANAASAQQEAILLADMSDDPAVGRSRARSVLASSARAYESVAQEASSFVQAVNTQPTPGPCVSLSQQYAALMQAHADAARALLRPLQALSAGTVEALEATREPARQEQERALRSAEEAARNAEAAMATLCIRYQLTKPPAIEMGN